MTRAFLQFLTQLPQGTRRLSQLNVEQKQVIHLHQSAARARVDQRKIPQALLPLKKIKAQQRYRDDRRKAGVPPSAPQASRVVPTQVVQAALQKVRMVLPLHLYTH